MTRFFWKISLFFLAIGLFLLLLMGGRFFHSEALPESVRVILWILGGICLFLGVLFYLVSVRRIDAAFSKFKKITKDLESDLNLQREERKRLKSILDTMQEGVMVLGAEGDIAWFNPAVQKLFGLKAGDLGKAPVEVIRNADLQEIVERCRSGESIETREIRLLLGEQESFLRVQATPSAGPAESLGAVIVMYDITPLRRLERVRRDFVANVSHELKTPLTSIRGYVETLLDSPMANDAQTKNFLGIIEANAERLSQLVEDLLRLSEIESQQFVLRPEAFAVRDLFEETLQIHAALLKKKSMWIETKVEPAALELFADRLALMHILNNLVENSIKYGDAQSPILLSCRRDGAGVRFSVGDRGIGIAKPHLDRIFERFYRVDRSRSRQEGSTGLGLAIVKHLVQLFGGEIHVTSREGEGSVFEFFCPNLVK